MPTNPATVLSNRASAARFPKKNNGSASVPWATIAKGAFHSAATRAPPDASSVDRAASSGRPSSRTKLSAISGTRESPKKVSGTASSGAGT